MEQNPCGEIFKKGQEHQRKVRTEDKSVRTSPANKVREEGREGTADVGQIFSRSPWETSLEQILQPEEDPMPRKVDIP